MSAPTVSQANAVTSPNSTAMNSTTARTALGIALLFALILPLLHGVEDATEPVGIYKIQVEQGNNLLVAGLVGRKEFQGPLTGSTPGDPASVLTASGASWTPGSFDQAASGMPTHYVEIVEIGHAAEGMLLDVVSNTATELTVAIGSAEFAQLSISGTETISIRAHATLYSIFKNATNIETDLEFVDIYNDDGSKNTYYYSGTNWRELGGTGAISNDRVVYPGQGLIFIARSPKELVIGGDLLAHVKTTPTRVNAYKSARLNLLGQVNPLVTESGQLGDLGFSDSLSPYTDIVLIYSSEGPVFSLLGTYFSDGTQMIDVLGTPSDSVPVPYGTAVRVLLHASSDDLSVLVPPGY